MLFESERTNKGEGERMAPGSLSRIRQQVNEREGERKRKREKRKDSSWVHL